MANRNDNDEDEAGVANVDDLGASVGIDLPEIVLPEELDREDSDRREILVNPSDLQDVGDPEAGDVGVAGGLAAGGEMGEGGYGHVGDDPWGLELMPEVDMAGTGSIGSEIGDMEDDKLAFEEEKL